jgi:RND superfamily putative drug exporter
MTLAARAPRRTLAVAALVLLCASVIALPVTKSLQPFSSDDPGSQSVAARHAIERATGVDPYFGLIALVPTPAGVASPASRALVARASAAIAADPLTAVVSSYYTSANPSLRARDGREMLVMGSLRTASISAQLAAARRVQKRLGPLHGVALGGLAAFYAQGNDTAQDDLVRAELIAFPLLMLLALWVFRGVVAATLPLLIGALTIVGTLAVLRLLSEVTSVSIYALNLTSALGLGLPANSRTLLLSRYRHVHKVG